MKALIIVSILFAVIVCTGCGDRPHYTKANELVLHKVNGNDTLRGVWFATEEYGHKLKVSIASDSLGNNIQRECMVRKALGISVK